MVAAQPSAQSNSSESDPAEMAETDSWLAGTGWSRVDWQSVISQNTIIPSAEDEAIVIDEEGAMDGQEKCAPIDAAIPESTKTGQNTVQISTEDEAMDIENVASPKRKRKSTNGQNVKTEPVENEDNTSATTLQRRVFDQYAGEPSREQPSVVDDASSAVPQPSVRLQRAFKKYGPIYHKRAASELPQQSTSNQNQVGQSRQEPLMPYENGTFFKKPRLEKYEQSAVETSRQQRCITRIAPPSRNNGLCTIRMQSICRDNNHRCTMKMELPHGDRSQQCTCSPLLVCRDLTWARLTSPHAHLTSQDSILRRITTMELFK
jgi:hypothetical protein